MNEGDWKILRWMADHRIITGLLTIAVFAYGLYGCWPSITEELPRFDPWHRWLPWIGDAAALLAVILWMIRPPKKVQAFDYASAVKLATMVVITIDVVVTISGLVSEKGSSLNSVPAVATVTAKSSHLVRLSQPKTFYEIEFQFQDVAGSPQTGRLEFSQLGDDKLPAWKTKLLGVFNWTAPLLSAAGR